MTKPPDPHQGPEQTRSFVEAARGYCQFVENASRHGLAERLRLGRTVLAKLLASGTALPLVDASTDKILLWDGTPPRWPGFGPYDVYREVCDPYVDEEGATGSLSNGFIDIYRDLKRGLVDFDGWQRNAVPEWRFHFDHHWGEVAVDALRALQRACTATAGDPVDVDFQTAPNVLVQTGGLVDETKISVGIYGADVDPTAISELLGVEATNQHRAGEARRAAPAWQEGAWIFTVAGTAPRAPEEVAEQFLAVLPPADAFPWTVLRSQHRVLVRIAVFFAGWNRGYAMSEETLGRLSRFTGSVDFDIYAH